MSAVETKLCPMCGAPNPLTAKVCTGCGEAVGSEISGNSILVSARRELLVSAAVWLAALVWSVGYSYLYGYYLKPDELKFVFGFPSWIFYGVVLPWGICTLVSGAFAFGFMQDADLGETEDAPPAPEGEDAAA